MARWAAAGVALWLTEVMVVLVFDRDMFLSMPELLRYAVSAAPMLVTVCVLPGVFLEACARLLGGRRGALSPHLAWLCAAAVSPLLAWLFWLLSEGRRVRDLPGRELCVLLLTCIGAVGCGACVRWLQRRGVTASKQRRWRLAGW